MSTSEVQEVMVLQKAGGWKLVNHETQFSPGEIVLIRFSDENEQCAVIDRDGEVTVLDLDPFTICALWSLERGKGMKLDEFAYTLNEAQALSDRVGAMTDQPAGAVH